MITVTEHFYDDDPLCGHPDVRTQLAGASYFFVGNGLIQAAVQFAPAGEGTPLGLLIMNPERFGKKRDALTMDAERGLEPTAIHLSVARPEAAATCRQPSHAALAVEWSQHHGVPAVSARWSSDPFEVRERFFCPDRSRPQVARQVTVRASGNATTSVHVTTGTGTASIDLPRTIHAGGETTIWILYTIDHDGRTVHVTTTTADPLQDDARRYWTECTHASFGDSLLDRLFNCCRWQLPAAVSRQGRIDGSIWQYNREWVRDQAFEALALVMAGHRADAETILRRLLCEFITDEGAPVDSSEVRGRDEVELDQTGVLLYALHQFVNWTGDTHLAASTWQRIVTAADFPLREEFRHHPSGMLTNRREFWERHAVHGIEPGFELAHQLFVSLGLSSAASLARVLARGSAPAGTGSSRLLSDAGRWERAAGALRHATLSHPTLALVDERGFIKRRRLNGAVQELVTALPGAQLPASVPLAAAGEHRLNPDTSSVLPAAFEWVEPTSLESARTLKAIEPLWNQAWASGGYGRYDVSSEPDSPGAWPFASIFVARAAVEASCNERAWRVLRWLDTVPGGAAGSWFEFYGPRCAPPFPQVGVIPWTWAEILFLLLHHVLGVRPFEEGIRLRPRLLPGLEHVQAVLPIRGRRLHVDIRAAADASAASCLVDGRPVEGLGGQWVISDDDNDVTVEIVSCR